MATPFESFDYQQALDRSFMPVNALSAAIVARAREDARRQERLSDIAQERQFIFDRDKRAEEAALAREERARTFSLDQFDRRLEADMAGRQQDALMQQARDERADDRAAEGREFQTRFAMAQADQSNLRRQAEREAELNQRSRERAIRVGVDPAKISPGAPYEAIDELTFAKNTENMVTLAKQGQQLGQQIIGLQRQFQVQKPEIQRAAVEQLLADPMLREVWKDHPDKMQYLIKNPGQYDTFISELINQDADAAFEVQVAFTNKMAEVSQIANDKAANDMAVQMAMLGEQYRNLMRQAQEQGQYGFDRDVVQAAITPKDAEAREKMKPSGFGAVDPSDLPAPRGSAVSKPYKKSEPIVTNPPARFSFPDGAPQVALPPASRNYFREAIEPRAGFAWPPTP